MLVTEGGTPVRLSASAWRLLEAIRSGMSFEALAEALSQRQGKPVSAAELEQAHQRLVDGLRRAAERSRRSLPPGFWLRLPLLSAAVVGRLASVLAPLFSRSWAVVLLPAVAGIFALIAAGGGDVLHPNWDAGVLWPAYGLFLLSLLAHELGHAGACARYGVAPRDIGFTMYLIYPALYSDVTGAWQLPRRRRVIVDVGGIYFQLLVGAVYAAVWLVTDWPALTTALWMILASCLFSLNPIFRFDGYWMLSDALGIDRLDDTPRRLLGHLASRWRGPTATPLPWPPWVVAMLAVYAPLAVAVWAIFLLREIPVFVDRVVALPEHLALAARTLTAPGTTLAAAGHVLHELAASAALLGFSGLIFWYFLRRLARLTQLTR